MKKTIVGWYPTIEKSEDEMFGDQLLGHPCLKEIEANISKKKRRFTIDIGRKTIKEIKAILERI
jgi:hypothetical protein